MIFVREWITHQDIHQFFFVLRESEYQVNNTCLFPVVTHR
ncbi:hypothetical protein ECL_00502 [Enterobacter cloacae subsp. cloacae ATCC 13047]|uniref:Uncharacterized protein n=1 Tax=Enterobacter cloacae subsp. cloacae (strain ATCC 13047 / DSM 30054 / NBRC 13535 / NCTC 10005 / WDCM 00083 / NCDC 279-56) TaxID=716541 RepID=A0A0H3CE07_ENTCC|nr:hypothetical protein ECL_00502 [Enterobacter cloacae subsp. cloacae ATCC 13047]KZR20099.1 hypothetical protein A3N67_06615 [Enterobacter hormaechei subsp. steigerwaltii]OOC76879.1 hypothetical protein BWP06_27245 [Enterobacter cloacae]